MTRITRFALTALVLFSTTAAAQRFRHIEPTPPAEIEIPQVSLSPQDSVIAAVEAVRGPGQDWSLLQVPPVFTGYVRMKAPAFAPPAPDYPAMFAAAADSIPAPRFNYPDTSWLTRGSRLRNLDRETQYYMMLSHPQSIGYALWKLPKPVKLMQDVYTRASFVRNMVLPEPSVTDAELSEAEIAKRHWLHVFDAGVQFSQAYLSPNWYQGGNNNISLLLHFHWNVQLNPVFHPNTMLVSDVQYKLGLYSTPQDKLHHYSISEDLFEWNFKTGIKATRRWFYSLTMRFKTQFLNSYVSNEPTLTSAFLSPAEFTVGLGMSYSISNKKNTLKFSTSLSPISYNLKTCVKRNVDPTQFNIPAGKKYHNQIGSTGELTLDWALTSNISYKSRLFLFSNYRDFIGDWENTIQFTINRFLSTQIYAHVRYDTSSDIHSGRWKNWMLKEILSFGFQYNFNTKPPTK